METVCWMYWYHYALLFYWLVASTWAALDAYKEGAPRYLAPIAGIALGWLLLPVRLIERVLR